MKTLIALLLLCATACAGINPSGAVGVIKAPDRSGSNFGTFVVVSPDGSAITAEHVRVNSRSTAFIGGKKYRVTMLVDPRTRAIDDEVPVFRLVSDRQFDYAPIASVNPAKGDKLWSIGYPKMKRKNWYSTLSGFWSDGSYRMSDGIDHGHSGGPLFNSAGEVVGIASASGFSPAGNPIPPSVWIGLKQIRSSYSRVQGYVERPTLVVFTLPGCQPCEQFKRVTAPKLSGKMDIVYITVRNGQWDNHKLASEFRRTTGIKKVNSVPLFWVRGTRHTRAGAGGILGWIQGLFSHIFKGVFGSPAEDQPQELQVPGDPQPDAPPVPIPSPIEQPESVEWSNVKIILLAARQDAKVSATARGVLLRLGIGPLERAVSERTDGKAALEVVSERLSPARFAAVTKAAGLTTDKFAVVVLIARQSLGLKSLIAKPIESAIASKLDGVPIDLIFERAHAATFVAIEQALKTPDVEAYEPNTPRVQVVPDGDSIASKVISGVKDILPGLLPKPTKQKEQDSTPIQVLITLVGGLLGIKTGQSVKSFLARRAIRKLVEKVT